jgi:exodeoxyribonuclease VII small subunit
MIEKEGWTSSSIINYPSSIINRKAPSMAERKQKDEIGKLTFEQAIQQLKGIVDRIEQGEIPLQDSLEQYEKGMALIKHCRDILQKAQKRIEKISREEPPEPEKKQEDSEPLLGG